MSEQIVTISKVFEEHGNGQKGPWTRYDVKDAGGNKYQTFNAQLGAQAKEAQGKSVILTYHEEARGQFTNYVIDAIKAQGSLVEAAQEAVNAPKSAASTETDGDRQLRIMRQSGLERAILTAAQLPDIFTRPIESVDELYALADQFVDYFVNGAPVDARL